MIIKGGTVLTGGTEFRADVVVRAGKIAYIGQDGESWAQKDNQYQPAEIIDAVGKYVAPGFIDLHAHGGDGADFGDGTAEAFRKVLAFHGSHGTTLLYPTSMTGSLASLHTSIEAYRQVKSLGADGAAMGGWHMEGPYFASSKRGAQDPRYLKNPDPRNIWI